MPHFTSITELTTWLTAQGINPTHWGSGVTKSVDNLWAEIMAGESQLQANPPLRLVRIVQLLTCWEDKTLVEVSQEFGQGQQRQRGLPPSEKMKPAESPAEAALRCLQEELQVQAGQVQLLSISEPEQICRQSPSYPGLLTCYFTYRVEVKVTGLPLDEFWTTENPHADGDPVTRHHWRWEQYKF